MRQLSIPDLYILFDLGLQCVRMIFDKKVCILCLFILFPCFYGVVLKNTYFFADGLGQAGVDVFLKISKDFPGTVLPCTQTVLSAADCMN